MSLSKYKEKRSFDKTPEPTGGKPTGSKLRFVVQKHHASHLHYDFRLELRGILKSWAVPKGPSMDPQEKRLAMLVEDHPWDYRDFEGIIPSGYGKGTVIVWDEGTYETTAIKETDKKAQERSITSQFWKGSITFTLHGHKLKGSFKIIRARDNRENAWFLVKVKDKYATTEDVIEKDKSILSKKTLEQVADNPDREWQSHKPAKADIQSDEQPSNEDSVDVTGIIKQGVKESMPAKVEPMVCTLIKEPFNDPAWVYELKLDGYRIMAHVKNKKASLHSRAGLNYSKFYPPVVDAFKNVEYDMIIDGEVAVLDENGKPDFDKLQKYKGAEPIVFYAFDIIWIDGYNVTGYDLLTRKSLLQQVLPGSDIIRYTDHFDDGDLLFEQVKKMELEGIVAKRKDSTYQIGKRSKDWLKLPTEIRQEFVIGGWTESENGRSFRTLVFGAYDKDRLSFIGHGGGGFKESEMPVIAGKLKELEVKKSPFVNAVDADTTVHYVKPVLVANFRFATWTASGKIRKPAIFLGFRDDKDPKDVVREIPLSETQEEKTIQEKSSSKSITITEEKDEPEHDNEDDKESYVSRWSKLENEEITSKDTFTIDGKKLLITNVEKELWSNVTKADLIQYYHAVARYILPHLKDRPQSLYIGNINAADEGFFIKDMEGRQPEWAQVFSIARKHKKKGKRKIIDYLVCRDEATLLYMVNLGCIEINPWTSRITNYQQPDYIIIDLDPSDYDFKKVIKTTLAAKQVFDKLKLKAFPKTSGKTGLHLYIPCKGFTFSEARNIAVNICKQISAAVPDITTIENTISNRGNKLFIDYNQNDEGDTVAAPYSVRPAKTPLVSAPLEWKEINEKLRPQNFDITNMLARIKKKGDLFKDVMNEKLRTSNSNILKKLV